MKINKPIFKKAAAISLIVALAVCIVVFADNIFDLIVYVLGLFAPFIIAYIISIPANPIADKMQKKFKLPKSLTAVIVIVLLVGIIGTVITLIIWKIVDELKSIYIQLPDIWKNTTLWFENFSNTFSNLYKSMPQDIQQAIDSTQANITGSISDFIKNNYKPVMWSAKNVAQALPSVFIGIIVFILSLFFMISNGGQVNDLIKKIFPQNIKNGASKVAREVKVYLGGYVKAQLIIMTIVFVILFIGLSILKVNYAMIIALGVAILDALPFFGTGAVLWPWAAISFINSNIKMGVGLIIIYLSVVLVRQLIEPKIVSSNIGMNPIFTLMSMYIGYKIFSISGMILGPIILMLVVSFYKAGAFDGFIRMFNRLVNYLKRTVKDLFSNIQTK